MAEKPKRTPLKLFMVYFLCFSAGLGLAYFVLTRLIEGIRAGEYMLLLLPPLAGMAVFHGLFPLLSRIRLGLEFVTVGGGLIYGLGIALALIARTGFLDPGAALVFWLAGVFGPGWWLLHGRAENAGYFK
ncbi:MAG: hypothetical protein ACK4HW_03880 [Roseinatronobacter sp.]